MVIKRLQEENERLCDKSSHDALEQYGRRNNLVNSGNPDSVQDSDLESTVTSILSNIDVNDESREVEDYLKRSLLDLSIGSIARKHCLTGNNWREFI